MAAYRYNDGSSPNSAENSGTVTSEANGTKFMEPYGKDDSDIVGAASAERGGKRGGSITNLSHSLNGASAVVNTDKPKPMT